MEKVEKRRMGWDKHKEMKLVHEVKKEVYSRDEATGEAYSKERCVIFRECTWTYLFMDDC